MSLREVAEAIRPPILNGTPTIVLGKTVDLLRAAVDDVIMGSNEAALDGEKIIAHYSCIKYDPETKLSEEYSYTAPHPEGMEDAVTLTYNWAVGTG